MRLPAGGGSSALFAAGAEELAKGSPADALALTASLALDDSGVETAGATLATVGSLEDSVVGALETVELPQAHNAINPASSEHRAEYD